ncbi:unnamed protein product [Closterium sp. NIES-53]
MGRGASWFRGVRWNKSSQKWAAEIRSGGPTNHLGLFPTKEVAALAYDAAPGGKVHAMCIIIVVHSVDILQIQVRGQCLKGMNWKLKRRKRMRKKDTKRRKTRKREQRKMRRTRMKSRRRKQKRGEQW